MMYICIGFGFLIFSLITYLIRKQITNSMWLYRRILGKSLGESNIGREKEFDDILAHMDKISKIAARYGGIISKTSSFAIWINAALGLWAGAMVGIGLQEKFTLVFIVLFAVGATCLILTIIHSIHKYNEFELSVLKYEEDYALQALEGRIKQ